MSPKSELVKARERTLYDVVHRRDDGLPDEVVGCHEDKAVAAAEAERLDQEAAALGQRGRHVLEPRVVIATDAEDDGNPPLEGPIVSGENVTRRSLKRGERPDNVIMIPGAKGGRGQIITP